MIAGTSFTIQPPNTVAQACLAYGRQFGMAVSEIEELQAECEAERAVCLGCEDGIVVVGLAPLNGGTLEMFVWLAVAFKHGAVERQDAALQAIARDLGAEAIAFCARRRGWVRRLGPEWTRRGSNEFVRPVS